MGLSVGLGLAVPNLSQPGIFLAATQIQSQDEESEVHIAPQDDCLAKMGDWSEPEKWAWRQICARERIDFDQRYGKPKNVDDLANDQRRILSAQFLRQILEDPRFQRYTRTAAVDIAGAYLPTLQVGNASIGALSLVDCKIGGDLYIKSVTVLRSIIISGSKIGDVSLQRIQGGNINFNASIMGDVQTQQLRITRLSFVGGSSKRLLCEFRVSVISLRSFLAGRWKRLSWMMSKATDFLLDLLRRDLSTSTTISIPACSFSA